MGPTGCLCVVRLPCVATGRPATDVASLYATEGQELAGTIQRCPNCRRLVRAGLRRFDRPVIRLMRRGYGIPCSFAHASHCRQAVSNCALAASSVGSQRQMHSVR